MNRMGSRMQNQIDPTAVQYYTTVLVQFFCKHHWHLQPYYIEVTNVIPVKRIEYKIECCKCKREIIPEQ